MADLVAIAPAAGLPDLLLGPVTGAALTLLTSDDLSAFVALSSPQWGIYLDGAPVVVADTVTDLGYTEQYSLSDYPIEEGGFATYDKVYVPFEARIRFVAGASEAARTALAQSIAAVADDLNLYEIVTPTAIYESCNFVRQEYRRVAQDGVGILAIDVVLEEVRILSSNTGTSPQAPSGADQQNGGPVQSVPLGQGGIGHA